MAPALPIGFRPEDLSEAWDVVFDSTVGSLLHQELQNELAVGHPLFGLPVQAVAVRQLRKETIWWLPAQATWAVVHLTWTEEADARWPSSSLAATWDDVIAELTDMGRP